MRREFGYPKSRPTGLRVVALVAVLGACSPSQAPTTAAESVPTPTSTQVIWTTTTETAATTTGPQQPNTSESCELARAIPIESDVPAPYFAFNPAEQCMIDGNPFLTVRPLNKGGAENAAAALEQLFAGVSPDDRADGFGSAFGVAPQVLGSVRQSEGLLHVDFSAAIYDIRVCIGFG